MNDNQNKTNRDAGKPDGRFEICCTDHRKYEEKSEKNFSESGGGQAILAGRMRTVAIRRESESGRIITVWRTLRDSE